jgi:hypothetical protein
VIQSIGSTILSVVLVIFGALTVMFSVFVLGLGISKEINHYKKRKGQDVKSSSRRVEES